jgi:Domain of unknown function (DUF4115)
VPAQESNTSAEALLRVLSTLTTEARRRQARTGRIRFRTKRASLACAVLVLLAFISLSVLVLSGFIDVHVLHVRPLASSNSERSAPQPAAAAGSVPRRVVESSAPRDQPARLGKTSVGAQPAPVEAAEKSQPVHRGPLTLVVSAPRGSSWIEARRGSATGQVVYAGTLAQGKDLRLQGERLWVRFGALAYLDLRLDGKPVVLAHTGTVNALFARSGVAPG